MKSSLFLRAYYLLTLKAWYLGGESSSRECNPVLQQLGRTSWWHGPQCNDTPSYTREWLECTTGVIIRSTRFKGQWKVNQRTYPSLGTKEQTPRQWRAKEREMRAKMTPLSNNSCNDVWLGEPITRVCDPSLWSQSVCLLKAHYVVVGPIYMACVGYTTLLKALSLRA